MRLFIVGATGHTGRLAVEQAIASGHAVTIMVRNPQMRPDREGQKVVVGNPLRVDDLVPVLPDHDVVISCLGQRSGKDAMLLRDAATVMLQAMGRSGIRRYLVISQGLLFPSRNPVVWLLRWILARHVADSTAMEKLVRTSDVDWTIVRPPRLQDGGTRRGCRSRAGAWPAGASAMQRADLAAFLIDETEKAKYIRAVVGVTSP